MTTLTQIGHRPSYLPLETPLKPEDVERQSSRLVRPPLKWVGGKRSILSDIHACLPVGRRGRFIEPFFGSGVVYLNTPGYSSYLLADINRDLIDLYGHIRADAMAVAALVSELFGELAENTQARYYEMREDFNTCPDGTLRRAALFIFLNRFGFNGMCRYNKSGIFNVPCGKSKTILNPTVAILAMGRTLLERPAQLICSDFRPLLALAGEGDTVYLDPPYLPLSATSNFNAYHSDGFTTDDQSELASLAREAAARGALVVISNHDTDFARQLYAGASLVELRVARSVGANANSRKRVGELLAVFGKTFCSEAAIVSLAAA